MRWWPVFGEPYFHLNVAPVIRRGRALHHLEPEFPVQVDRRLEDGVGLEIHVGRILIAGTVEQGPAEPPPDSHATNALVHGHLGELIGTASPGYESDRSDRLTFVERHENRAAGVENVLPRVVEIEAIGVLDLPVKSDPVKVHLTERVSMLRPKIDDLDLRAFAPLGRLFHVTDMEDMDLISRGL